MADECGWMKSDGKYLNKAEDGGMYSNYRFYEIHVQGQLGSDWSEWLENLEVQLLENGEMILYGPIADQAALMGVLNKLNRLNLALLSINEIKDEKKETK
jgi:hypothetical protein